MQCLIGKLDSGLEMLFLISFARSFDSAARGSVYGKHKVFIVLHQRFVSLEHPIIMLP